MLGDIGFPELVVIFLIILLVFGAGRLPEIGRSLGRSIGEFKKGLKGDLEEKTDSSKTSPDSEKKNS